MLALSGTGFSRPHLGTWWSLKARIVGKTKVVVFSDPASAIQTTSRDAASVFLGMETPEVGHEDDFLHRIERLVGNLPQVALLRSAGGMRLES